MIDLYNKVAKEATNIWKKAMRDGSQLIAWINKDKQIPQECAHLTKDKLGIYQLKEGRYPLEDIKGLVEEVIDTGEKNCMEIQHLKRENKEIR
jgi:hypothetical protein